VVISPWKGGKRVDRWGGRTRFEKSMIRVLHIIDKLSVDGSGIHGIARALEWWATRVDPKEVQFRILSLRGREEEAAEFFEKRGIDLRFVKLGKFDLRTVPVLCREALNWQADVLHLHGYASTNFGRIASRLISRPNVVHEHVVFPSQPIYQEWADALLAGITDSSLAISPAVADFMIRERKVPAEGLETFFYGIPFDEFEYPEEEAIVAARKEAGIPEGARVIVTAGRLAPQKGLSVLVKSFAAVAKDHPDVYLVIVGEGPERETVVKAATAAGISDRVKLVGFQKDVRPWIAMGEIFVIASLYEGGPITLFEAMRLSRAIISTPVGLVPQAIRHGENGWLVPVDDSEALSLGLRALLEEPDRAQTFARQAFEDSDKWDVHTSVARLTRFYQRLVSKKR
jgi:glycosyltransferase involved in cell wall biosynthesis